MVAPASSGKTSIIEAFEAAYDYTYHLSKLTSTSLISGAKVVRVNDDGEEEGDVVRKRLTRGVTLTLRKWFDQVNLLTSKGGTIGKSGGTAKAGNIEEKIFFDVWMELCKGIIWFVKAKGLENEFPLFTRIHQIAFEGAAPETIVQL